MKRVLCIGGNGSLGRKISEVFHGLHFTSMDFHANSLAHSNILLKGSNSTSENHQMIACQLQSEQPRYDSIIVTAGAWLGGSIKDDDYLSKLKMMNEANLYPSFLAAHLATKYLNPKGLVIFTGAAAVFKEPQPDMIAYALAKTGVHSLAMNLSEKMKSSEARVITILPEIIDTEANRAAMSNADFTGWLKPQQIAQLLLGWVGGLNVPNNGSFVVLGVKNGCVVPTLV